MTAGKTDLRMMNLLVQPSEKTHKMTVKESEEVSSVRCYREITQV